MLCEHKCREPTIRVESCHLIVTSDSLLFRCFVLFQLAKLVITVWSSFLWSEWNLSGRGTEESAREIFPPSPVPPNFFFAENGPEAGILGFFLTWTALPIGRASRRLYPKHVGKHNHNIIKYCGNLFAFDDWVWATFLTVPWPHQLFKFQHVSKPEQQVPSSIRKFPQFLVSLLIFEERKNLDATRVIDQFLIGVERAELIHQLLFCFRLLVLSGHLVLKLRHFRLQAQ